MMDQLDDAHRIAALQQEWILLWDRPQGVAMPSFGDRFGRFYDFEADVILHDEADPQLRTFRRVQDYADAFWPTFTALRSAKHAIPELPEVLVSGDLAVGRMVFIAVLTSPRGELTSLRCINSLVWRRTEERDWYILRDQTAVQPVPDDEAEAAFS